MKIVNIILTSQNGGAEQVCLDYTSVLQKLGHEMLVILKEDAPYADEFVKLNVPVKKIKNKFGYHDFFAIKKIQDILQEFDADLVISHIGRSTILTKKAIKKLKTNKKIIQVAVNHSDNVKRSIGSDVIFSVNKTIFYRTIDLGQSEAASFVIPNAIDLSDAVTGAPNVDLRHKEKIVIGVIGRLDRTKGFHYAIKALKSLEKISDKKFVLRIAGSGYHEAALRALVKELNLEDKVEFLGWIKDKKLFFDSIDIFCLPSQNEPFGLVLLEAMKYQKPIISVDADGPKEILRNEIDALIVNLRPLDNTEERIAMAVVRMINEPNLVNLMIESSSQRLVQKFSYKALETRMKECLGVAENK